MLVIREDDLSGAATRELLALHLSGMHANSPAGQVFALDLSGLRTPDITLWSIWEGDAIAGIGALRMMENGRAEIKSMRTHPAHLRKGVAAALLDHILAVARARGVTSVHLETGSGSAFEPAIALYRRRGFVEAEPFGSYERSAFNQFFALRL